MTQALEFDMAKAKAKPARKSEDGDRKPMIVQLRGSTAYKEWAERLARADGSTLAALVDRALRRYAKEIEFTDRPPER